MSWKPVVEIVDGEIEIVKTDCTKCHAEDVMIEYIDEEGRVKHEHDGCGALMVWKPRNRTLDNESPFI